VTFITKIPGLISGAASMVNRKAPLTAILMAALFCGHARGSQNVTLAWDANPETNVVGYVVHYGNVSGVYTNSVNVTGDVSATLTNLQEGTTYYFAVTAYNSDGLESIPSSEISYEVPIVFHAAGPNLEFTSNTQSGGAAQIRFLGSANQTYELQATADLQNWTTIWYSLPQTTSQWLEYQDADAVNSAIRFYRVIVH
jgi:hypothetical protein